MYEFGAPITVNARLTPTGGRILVESVLTGRTIAHVVREMGISRTCAHR